MPDTSVVIPTYNRARLIRKTILSLLDQTLPPTQIIVVDDGSSDNTPEVIREFAERVEYVWQPNGGDGSARNTGLRRAKCEYVAFLDSDDLWLPNKLEVQRRDLERTGYAWTFSDVSMFSDEDPHVKGLYSEQAIKPQCGFVAPKLLFGNFIASPSPLIRRAVFDQVGEFAVREELDAHADWDMWLRIAAKHKLSYLPEVLAKYRVHAASKTKGATAYSAHINRRTVLERAVRLEPTVYAPFFDDALALEFVRASRALLGAGDLPGARVAARNALRSRPHWLSPYLLILLTYLGRDIASGLTVTWRRMRAFP